METKKARGGVRPGSGRPAIAKEDSKMLPNKTFRLNERETEQVKLFIKSLRNVNAQEELKNAIYLYDRGEYRKLDVAIALSKLGIAADQTLIERAVTILKSE